MESRICPMNSDVQANAQFLQRLIVGYGFRPTEEELINYLKSEEPGLRESFCIIPTLQDFYKINPWDLSVEFNEKSIIPSNDQECWFICPKTQNGRKTPCGSSWKITGKTKDVKAGNDSAKIGSKKVLVFPSGAPTTWVMHEYNLLDSDLNRNYVLCHVMHRREEKHDTSSIANYLPDSGSYRHQTDPEELVFKGLSPIEDLDDDLNRYLIDAHFSHGDQMQTLTEDFENQSAMDFTLDNSLYEDFIDARLFPGEQMQTQYGQTTNLHRQTQKIDSFHGVVPIKEKKGIVENNFRSSLVAPEKPVVPPVRCASVKYNGKDEVLMFEKVKQETAAKEHRSAGNSPKKENSKEIEHAREKSNSVTALTRPTTMSTKCSASPRLISLRNIVVTIFLLNAIAKSLI